MGQFFLIGLLGILLLSHCRERVETSVQEEYFVPEKEIKSLMSSGVLVLPIVPVKGEGILGADYGKFVNKLRRKRQGQYIRIYGDNKNRIDSTQIPLFQEYVKTIQESRKIPDSLVYKLKGKYKCALTLTPMVLDHQINRLPDGKYQRRISIQVEGWNQIKKEKILFIKSIGLHKAKKKNELVSGEVLLLKGLENLAEQIFYDIPMSSISAGGNPDF